MDYDEGLGDSERSYSLPPEPLDTDFKRMYPPDVLGREMDDQARVWRVYADNAGRHDMALLAGWNDTVDVLLLFAGLFSAVATAFVIESYKFLQPDNTAYTAVALYMLVAASNQSTGMQMHLPPPPSLQQTSPLAVWINGLWFTSIVISLAVSLLCILVKQWIGEYRARVGASANGIRTYAHRRELYFQALKAWPVDELVSFLPVLLHISLFLFTAGIIAFLWTLNRAISVWILIIGLSLAFIYFFCTLIPLWIPECPTSTPIVSQMRSTILVLQIALFRLCAMAISLVSRLRRVVRVRARARPIQLILARLRGRDSGTRELAYAEHEADFGRLPLLRTPVREDQAPSLSSWLSLKVDRLTQERRSTNIQIARRLEQNRDRLDVSVLRWLILEQSGPSAVAVGMQCLGAIPPHSSLAVQLRAEPQLSVSSKSAFMGASGAHNLAEIARVVRSFLCMHGPRHIFAAMDTLPLPSSRLLWSSDYPDIVLIRCLYDRPWGIPDFLTVAPTWRTISPSLTSTAMHILRLQGHPILSLLTLLECCTFEEVFSTDWEVIILHATQSQQTLSTLRASDISTRLRVADLLAQMATRPDSKDDLVANTATRLLHRLLGGIDHDEYASSSLSDQPFLLGFLASDRSLHPSFGLVNMEALPQWLYTERALAVDLRYTARFLRTLAYLFRGARSVRRLGGQETTGSVVIYATLICIDALKNFTHWRLFDVNTPQLSITLECIIFPFPHLDDSLWTMAYGRGDLDPSRDSRLDLVEVLAAGLCLLLRRDGATTSTAALIERYFETIPTRNGFAMLGNTTWDNGLRRFSYLVSRRRAVHFVQHWVELSPTWWMSILHYVHHADEVDQALRRRILQIDEESSRRGPCQHCPYPDWGYGEDPEAPIQEQNSMSTIDQSMRSEGARAENDSGN